MQEFTGIIRHFPVSKSNCLHLYQKCCPVAETTGMCSVLPAGLGPGDRKAALQPGFPARYVAPSSLEGGLPWYQAWKAVAAFPNWLFQSMFFMVSRHYDNDGGSPAGCAVGRIDTR